MAKTKYLQIRIDESLANSFKDKLKKENMTQSKYIRYAIKKYLKDPKAYEEIINMQNLQQSHWASVKDLKNEISRIGNNLNQYIHNMNIKMKEGVLEENAIKEISYLVANTMEDLLIVVSKKEKEVSENA